MFVRASSGSGGGLECQIETVSGGTKTVTVPKPMKFIFFKETSSISLGTYNPDYDSHVIAVMGSTAYVSNVGDANVRIQSVSADRKTITLFAYEANTATFEIYYGD